MKIFNLLKPILIVSISAFISFAIICGHWLQQHLSEPRQKYAVLISCGNTMKDDRIVHSEYWYDLIMSYKSLIDQGYTHKNIFVFYGDGPNSDFNSKYKHYNIKHLFPNMNTIIDYDNQWETIQDGLKDIDFYTTRKDKILLYWIVGHGGIPYWDGSPSQYRVSFEDWSITQDSSYQRKWRSYPKDTINMVINLIDDYKQREIYWMTCHSGCMVEGNHIPSNLRTTIITSSHWKQSSFSSCPTGYDYWSNSCLDYISGEFNWTIYGVFNRTYFDGTAYRPYNLKLEYPINPSKLYYELKNSDYMSSRVQIGGKSPFAVYCSVKDWKIEKIDNVKSKVQKTKLKIKRFFQNIKNFFTRVTDEMFYKLGYERISD